MSPFRSELLRLGSLLTLLAVSAAAEGAVLSATTTQSEVAEAGTATGRKPPTVAKGPERSTATEIAEVSTGATAEQPAPSTSSAASRSPKSEAEAEPVTETAPDHANGDGDEQQAESPGSSGTSEQKAEPASPDLDPRVRRARRVIARGETLFAASNYEGALVEFNEAYRLLDDHPSQYIVLYNIAVCHERSFRYDLALKHYREYLERAPATDESRQKVLGVLSTLGSLLATLKVETNVSAEAWAGDRYLGKVPGEVLLPSGSYTLEIKAKGYESARQQVSLAAGQSQKLKFELTRLSTQHGPQPAYFYTAVGLSLTATIAGGVFGSMALAEHNAGQELKDDGFDPQAHGARARDLALAADVAFGTALVLGASATVLYFVTDWEGDRQAQPRDVTSGFRLGGTPQTIQAAYRGYF